jgi:hypothetical protein
MTKSTKTQAVKAPSFDAYAKPIIRGYESFDKAASKLRDVVQSTMQAYIDTCAKAGIERDQKGCTALGKAIRECETVANIVASGAMEKKTFTEYAQAAMRAHFHAVPFEASLKNNPDFALPWGKAKESKPTTKAGSMKTLRAPS